MDTKCCSGCNETKPVEAFNRDRRRSEDGRQGRCKTCCHARDAEYRAGDGGAKASARGRAWRTELRSTVLAHYGGRCVCCGETGMHFLAIDHIDGGGHQHRSADPSAHTITLWLKRNGFPPGFRVLCHNCNTARGVYGYCPHERAAGAAA